MSIFDFWKSKKTPRAGVMDVPSSKARARHLASHGGKTGIEALFISGFERDERIVPERLIHGRFLGRRTPEGKIEFVEASRAEASDWLTMISAMRRAYEVVHLQRGGVIVLATDVNVTAGAGIWDKVKALVSSFIQRYFARTSKVEEAVETVEERRRQPDQPEAEPVVPGYSIGNLFQGSYYDTVEDPATGEKKRKLFSEQSFAVEIRGVDTPTLNEVADAIRQGFSQRSVLVKNDNDNQVYLIQEGQTEAAPEAA